MGTDIHFFVETQDPNTDEWSLLLPDVAEQCPHCSGTKTDPDTGDKCHVCDGLGADADWEISRNYLLFGVLAGVRGRTPAIISSGRRGLPDDACAFLKERGAGGAYHSHHWLSLAELSAFPWDGGREVRAYVYPHEWPVFRARGGQDVWRTQVAAAEHREVSNSEMDAIVHGVRPTEPGYRYVTVAAWERAWAQDFDQFISGPLASLQKLPDPARVRTVFWFDN
jgi:hypothetical protein